MAAVIPQVGAGLLDARQEVFFWGWVWWSKSVIVSSLSLHVHETSARFNPGKRCIVYYCNKYMYVQYLVSLVDCCGKTV